MRRLKIIFVLLLFISLFHNKGYASEAGQLYSQAIKNARCGKIDFAFIDYFKLLNRYPDSKLAEKALFATGEYYLSIDNDSDAKKAFKRFINKYPQSNARPFALAYLLKMAVAEAKIGPIKKYENQIISAQQLSLLFRDSKKRKYLSPLYKKHKAFYFIDRVEFYINEELFVKIFY